MSVRFPQKRHRRRRRERLLEILCGRELVGCARRLTCVIPPGTAESPLCPLVVGLENITIRRNVESCESIWKRRWKPGADPTFRLTCSAKRDSITSFHDRQRQNLRGGCCSGRWFDVAAVFGSAGANLDGRIAARLAPGGQRNLALPGALARREEDPRDDDCDLPATASGRPVSRDGGEAVAASGGSDRGRLPVI